MQVFVNGESIAVEPASLDEMLVSLGYECKKVAVAINEQFVPREEWSVRELQSEDRVDVLGAIQGG